MNNFKRIYLVSPDKEIDLSLLRQVFLNFHEYIFAFQLRFKTNKSFLVTTTKKVSKLCLDYNVPLIINDYLDLALALHKDGYCDGVHLGQDDLSKQKKFIPPQMKLGISCYDKIDLAIQAVGLGTSYVSFGKFFPSKTKPDAPGRPTTKILQSWLATSEVPAVAIGGITADNCTYFAKFPKVIIALSHYVWSHKNAPLSALETLLKKL